MNEHHDPRVNDLQKQNNNANPSFLSLLSDAKSRAAPQKPPQPLEPPVWSPPANLSISPGPLEASSSAQVTPDASLEKPQDMPSASSKPMRSRKKLGRNHRIEIRVTEKEFDDISFNASRYGYSQGEYIRHKVLRTALPEDDPSKADAQAIVALDVIRADVGRIGGMLKSAIRPNEGSSNITREEWQVVFQGIRDFETTKTMIQQALVKMNGNAH